MDQLNIDIANPVDQQKIRDMKMRLQLRRYTNIICYDAWPQVMKCLTIKTSPVVLVVNGIIHFLPTVIT